MGVFAYVLLGTIPESCVGPTAVTSLMTFAHSKKGGPGYATLLAFLCGLVELVAGLLNLGNRLHITLIKYLVFQLALKSNRIPDRVHFRSRHLWFLFSFRSSRYLDADQRTLWFAIKRIISH